MATRPINLLFPIFISTATAATFQAIAHNDSTTPLQITIQSAKQAAASAGPASLQGRLGTYTTLVQNISGRPISLYVLRWVPESAAGEMSRGIGHCDVHASLNPLRPVLGPGQVHSDQNTILQGGDHLAVVVDLVLTSDGTIYGANICDEVGKFQQALTARRTAERWILNLLQTQGPDAVRSALQKELANTEADSRLLRANRAPR